MNSSARTGFVADRALGVEEALYSGVLMTRTSATIDPLLGCPVGGNSLGQSRVAMSEVQICGIPKPSNWEEAPTS
jgi:hypothetical protein